MLLRVCEYAAVHIVLRTHPKLLYRVSSCFQIFLFVCFLLSLSASLLHILIFISYMYAGNHHDDVSSMQMTATSNHNIAIHTNLRYICIVFVVVGRVFSFSSFNEQNIQWKNIFVRYI